MNLHNLTEAGDCGKRTGTILNVKITLSRYHLDAVTLDGIFYSYNKRNWTGIVVVFYVVEGSRFSRVAACIIRRSLCFSSTDIGGRICDCMYLFTSRIEAFFNVAYNRHLSHNCAYAALTASKYRTAFVLEQLRFCGTSHLNGIVAAIIKRDEGRRSWPKFHSPIARYGSNFSLNNRCLIHEKKKKNNSSKNNSYKKQQRLEEDVEFETFIYSTTECPTAFGLFAGIFPYSPLTRTDLMIESSSCSSRRLGKGLHSMKPHISASSTPSRTNLVRTFNATHQPSLNSIWRLEWDDITGETR